MTIGTGLVAARRASVQVLDQRPRLLLPGGKALVSTPARISRSIAKRASMRLSASAQSARSPPRSFPGAPEQQCQPVRRSPDAHAPSTRPIVLAHPPVPDHKGCCYRHRHRLAGSRRSRRGACRGVPAVDPGRQSKCCRWIIPAERPIIPDIGPDPADIGLALCEDRHSRIIAMQTFRGQNMGRNPIVQGREHRRCRPNLIGKRRDRELDPLPRITLTLPA